MGRLSFRLAAAMAVLAIAILLGVGIVTSVSLRSLHAQAKEANLALLSRTLLTQARTEAMQGNLRAAIRDLDAVLADQGVTPWLLLADGRLHGLDGGPGRRPCCGRPGRRRVRAPSCSPLRTIRARSRSRTCSARCRWSPC